ncbi:MAG: methionyl-tRNA formyltransferase [Spirochaetales bacterium]|nr:methionyl-tRNA formyltransferase [Spirochaetales bacterium]
MRILFAGTPDIAVPSLQALAAQFEVVGVLTAPDRKAGRGRSLQPSPVKACALELGLSVLQPPRLGAQAREEAATLQADLLVVFAYGRIFGPKFLSLFPQGAINMHPSALPQFRGPSPISAALLAGLETTALTVQDVALEMDSGDILAQDPFLILPEDTTASLTLRVAQEAAPVLCRVVGQFVEGTAVRQPQNHEEATYCHLVKKEDGLVDWNSSAAEIERCIRAYSPWPKARTPFAGGDLALLEAQVLPAQKTEDAPGTVLGVDNSLGILIQTGDGVLAVTRLQAPARKPLGFREFLNGLDLEAGTRLGETS